MKEFNNVVTTIRSGWQAQIIYTEASMPEPIVAMITDQNGEEYFVRYNLQGRSKLGSTFDLMLPITKHQAFAVGNPLRSPTYRSKEGLLKDYPNCHDGQITVINWEEVRVPAPCRGYVLGVPYESSRIYRSKEALLKESPHYPEERITEIRWEV